jgi:hypothetical protein
MSRLRMCAAIGAAWLMAGWLPAAEPPPGSNPRDGQQAQGDRLMKELEDLRKEIRR